MPARIYSLKEETDTTGNSHSVFDSFAWWDQRDVLFQITPARFDYLRSVSGPLSGQKVLDVGCGGGYLAEPLAREGAEVTGIDVSEAALEVARRHAALERLDIQYLRSPAENMPLLTESFDLVVAFDVLEHVADLEKTINEIARVLKGGGKLIYDTNNRTFLSRLVMNWIGENFWPGGPPKGTHNWNKFIKPAELITVLSRHGIVNKETKGFLPKGVDLHFRLMMRVSRFDWISYVGYGVKKPQA